MYFRIEELVCPHTFNKFGELSWRFLSTEYLHTLLILRTEVLDVPMIINDYVFGGNITQRGLRCNICLLYTSDAADDLLCVDLGGRRILKKKKKIKNKNLKNKKMSTNNLYSTESDNH